MTAAARERLRIRIPLLLSAAAGWVLLWLTTEARTIPGRAGMNSMEMGAAPMGWSNTKLAEWSLMILAMMLPALRAPIAHLYEKSFADRRLRAIALFLISYAAVWIAAGLLIMPLAMQCASPTGVCMALMLIAVWQCSPVKQYCLNRCHARPELAAFEGNADRDALRFGMVLGIWCVGGCWMLMALPMMLRGEELAAMMLVTLWISAERLERTMVPRWHVGIPWRGIRIVIAQGRMFYLGIKRSF